MRGESVSTLEVTGDVPVPSVLIVDDRPANLLALEAILAGPHLHLVRASTGAEALRQLLKHDFALVLLDVQMPGMDGFETASAIKAHPRTADIPIIFVTAISREASLVFKGYERGAVDYVLKPFDPLILKAKVSIFVDLYMKGATIKAQAKLLREREVAALERRTALQYRRLADSMPLILWASHPDGTVYYANRAWSEYSDVRVEQTVPVTHPGIVHAEDLPQVEVAWGAARDGGLFEAEMRMRRTRDGAYRWHLVRGVMDRTEKTDRTERTERAEGEGWIVTATDIHEKKEAEAAREQLYEREQVARQFAESANRIKDEFLANVSHELRTPLTSILGWAGMLRAGMLDAAGVQRALETIERNANVQTALVEDLLDVSRVMSGKLRLRRQPVELVAATKAATETMRPDAAKKGVILACETDLDALEVSADPERFHQIVCNLVGNAVKFTPAGGRIDVRVDVASEDLVEITVTDSGVGIPAKFLPYVFDRFRQADNSVTREHQGLGLGLAIVRHLVELHQGRVEAHSDGLGRGAKFRVQLPIRTTSPASGPFAAKALREPPASFTPADQLAGLRVLVVDGQSDSREQFEALLRRYGATVVAVETSGAALRELDSAPFDLLLNDLGLAADEGYALIRAVRLRPATSAGLPAIAVSGFSRSDDARRAVAEGFQVYLPKPVDPSELIGLVGSLAGARGAAN